MIEVMPAGNVPAGPEVVDVVIGAVDAAADEVVEVPSAVADWDTRVVRTAANDVETADEPEVQAADSIITATPATSRRSCRHLWRYRNFDLTDLTDITDIAYIAYIACWNAAATVLTSVDACTNAVGRSG